MKLPDWGADDAAVFVQATAGAKPGDALISKVNWMRYTVLKPGQSHAGFEDPSAILKKETWSHLGGKFKRS